MPSPSLKKDERRRCHVMSFHDPFSCEVTFVYHHEGMALHSKYIDKKSYAFKFN